jgi:hypothetical protein
VAGVTPRVLSPNSPTVLVPRPVWGLHCARLGARPTPPAPLYTGHWEEDGRL